MAFRCTGFPGLKCGPIPWHDAAGWNGLKSYGQVDRPERVPADYVRVERDLGTYVNPEDADMAAASFEKPPGTLESEVTQNQLDEGVQVTASYWAPPEAAGRGGWVYALIGTAVGISVLGVGLSMVYAQDRRKK